MSENSNDELVTEDEVEDVPYVEYDISVNPSDPTLELLSKQVEREDIIIPFYQRKYVWKIEQASRLIESFLMGLPVPQLFLYVNDDDQLEVIDGQQRLMSVHYFLTGLFGEPDSNGKRTVFRLKGLAERSGLNGLTFKDLPTKDQRKLRNSTLRSINIKQIKPHGENDAVFHIFERLNTGGTLLKPQEIRNAVYRGKIVSELQFLNKNPDWQQILGLKNPDKSQKDVELILRLFSLYENWENYQKPMLRFLNRQMSENRTFDSPRAMNFSARFVSATSQVVRCIEKPFRPKRVVNAAVLEAVLIALMEDCISDDELKSNYNALLNNEKFSETIYGSTTDENVLKIRIQLAKTLLKNGQ